MEYLYASAGVQDQKTPVRKAIDRETCRKRPFLTRVVRRRPSAGSIPGQQVVEAAHRVGQAFENVPKIGERLDVIKLRGRQQSGDDRPALGPAIGAGEQMVL